MFFFGVIPAVTHNLAHHGVVLLLYVAVIILAVRAAASEGDTLGQTVFVEGVVDKFAAIVRIYAQDRERKPTSVIF